MQTCEQVLEENRGLRVGNAALKAQVAELTALVAELKARIAQLEAKLAKADRSSSNPSKPPSCRMPSRACVPAASGRGWACPWRKAPPGACPRA